MFDPANAPKPEAGFGENDKSTGFQKDERFLLAESEKSTNEWNLIGGDNYICVLPSDSKFGETVPAKPQDYKIGLPFLRVTVRPPGVKRMRNYKITGKDNPLTKAYWRLYESIGKAPLWKEITAGFQAGGDNRRVLQVVTIKGGGKVSPVKMWSVTDTRGGETKPGQKPTMYEMVKEALQQIFRDFKKPENGGNTVFPFLPQSAAVLKVTVLFQGEIPQFTIAPYYENGKPVILNLTPQWDASDKDMAAKWIAEPDELPDITTLETVMRSPQACQILGLTTTVQQPAAAQAPPLPTAPQFSTGPSQAQTVGQFQQQVAANPAFVPQGAPPMGFGALASPVTGQHVPQAAQAASPVTGQPVGAPVSGFGVPQGQPMGGPVSGAPTVVNPVQGGAQAAQQFTAGLQEELARRAAAVPGVPGKNGEPPF